ncbi:MAG: hypothetical protein JSW61_00415 [Candidatus Thorarchaeota archaeon]|nr:MAG: hypothetical protein JSW61_00415 [Candidatus Thorarchaeota archaeon]
MKGGDHDLRQNPKATNDKMMKKGGTLLRPLHDGNAEGGLSCSIVMV